MTISQIRPGHCVRIGEITYEVIEHQPSGTRVRITNSKRVRFINKKEEEVIFDASSLGFIISSGSEVEEI